MTAEGRDDRPSWPLAVDELLAADAARRRRPARRARGVTALVAVLMVVALVAAVAWLALSGDRAGTERLAWDPADDFEAPLPFAPQELPGLAGGTLVREPGAGRFTVRLPGQGAATVDPERGRVPEGVSLFADRGATLVVSEMLYDGWPALDPAPAPGYTRGRGMARIDDAGGDDVSVYAWVIDEPVDPSWVRDVYWLLPEAVLTSRGDPVLNEVIDLGEEQVPVMVVEPTGRWTLRWRDSMQRIFTAGDPDDVLVQGNLVLTVLPADARSVRLTLRGQAYDEDRQLVNRERVVVPTVRFVGDYQLAWARIDPGDWVQPTSPHAAAEPRAVATWRGGGQP